MGHGKQKLELVEKAWVVNPANFKERHFAPEKVCYAQSEGKAKKKLLDYIKYEELQDWHGNTFSFTTLKIKRAKGADKYLVDGTIKTLYEIQSDGEYKQRSETLDKLVSENPTAKAYIRKGGYYYCPNHCGYTELMERAGVYSIQEAVRCVKNTSLSDYMRVVVIDNEQHNKMIEDKIADLKRRIINPI